MMDVHDTLCHRLKDQLKQNNSDLSGVTAITGLKKMIHFYKKRVDLDLGEVRLAGWSLRIDVALSKEDSMRGMAATRDGRMAVGNQFGGIDLFSADGKVHQTILKDVNVVRVAILSDGQFVVSDNTKGISMYTSEGTNLDVSFETIEESGWPCLACSR